MKTPDPSSLSSTGKLLSQQYRWMRTGRPLLVAVIGLVVLLAGVWIFHPSFARLEKWGSLPVWWGAGLAGLFVFCGLLWYFRRRSLLNTARLLDEDLSAMNRLETATTLRNADDPMAQAQREETARFLEQTPSRSQNRTLTLLASLAALLVLAHLFTLLVWTQPWVKSLPLKAAATPTPTPAPSAPKASITWKTPKSETKAASVEEVPLEAAAESASGLKDLSLEISVNGEHRLSVPVPVEALEKPGRVKVNTSLYLDQVEVEPYDMISYHLKAQRLAPEKLPPTVSPVQFVEVKPFRDDVKELPGGMGKRVYPYITALKVAQLRLLKENFYLSNADLERTNPIWLKENQRVTGEQSQLGVKAGEVIEMLIADGEPAVIVDLLNQAKPLMQQSSDKIGEKQNSQATPLQGKSLSLITEIEKYVVKATARDGKEYGKAKSVNDPFQKQKEIELKQRYATQAGLLELLAKEQLRLSTDLNHAKNASSDPGKNAPPPTPMPDGKPSNPNRIDGSFAEREAQVSQQLASLLNQTKPVFGAEVQEHLEKAHPKTKEVLQQLDAEDIPMARGPAADAALELKLALDALFKAGEEATKEALAQALQNLNQAGSEARKSGQAKSDQEARDAATKAAEKVEQSRQQLAEEAKKQQETGSAEAAKRLAAAASALNDAKLREEMKKLRDHPRDASQANRVAEQLSSTADRVARAPGANQKSPEEIAQLIERIERSSANLKRLAANQRTGSQPSSQNPGQPGKEAAAGHDQAKEGKAGQEQKSDQGDQKCSQPGQGKQTGESKQPGQGKEPGKGEQPGESKQPGEGQGASETMAKGSQPGSGHSPGESPAQSNTASAQSSSSSSGEGTGLDLSSGPGGSNSRERFSKELIEDLRREFVEAELVLPAAPEIKEVHKALYEDPHTYADAFTQVVAAFEKIEAPLDTVISLLRAQLQQTQRQHKLASQDPTKAPAAYREAVADYFERLSRDYQTSPQNGEVPAQ